MATFWAKLLLQADLVKKIIFKTVLNMVWIRIETFPKWEPELESIVSVFTTLTPY